MYSIQQKTLLSYFNTNNMQRRMVHHMQPQTYSFRLVFSITALYTKSDSHLSRKNFLLDFVTTGEAATNHIVFADFNATMEASESYNYKSFDQSLAQCRQVP